MSHAPSTGLSRRSFIRNAGLGFGATGVVLASAPDALAHDRGGSATLGTADLVALAKLKADHAVGTDAIGAGDFDRGLALYRRVFTPTAHFAGGFDESQPFFEATGPEAYAESNRAALAGTRGSHHLIGTSNAEPGDRWRTAHVIAYFHAAVLSGTENTITTYLGVYQDQAVRMRDGWRITDSFAKYFSIETSPRDAP